LSEKVQLLPQAESLFFDRKDTPRVHITGTKKLAMEIGRNRLLVTGMVIFLAFAVVGGRLVTLVISSPGTTKTIARTINKPIAPIRGEIVDRNGIILATSLPISSLYADPQEILDIDEAADKLSVILPSLSREELRVKLNGKGRFVWLRRNLTPQQVYNINALRPTFLE
jgi:cell division protein FtsI (penicillin-binding protein 3)